MTSDCADTDTSPWEQRDGLQPESDSVTNVCVFSTGNHCKSLRPDQEQKTTFLLTEHCQTQASIFFFYNCVIYDFGNKIYYCKLGAAHGKCSEASRTMHLAVQLEAVFEQYLQFKYTEILRLDTVITVNYYS